MKDRPFIIISYYTKNTGYELEAEKLIESLERFDLPYYVKGIDTLGSWQANTQYKVKFIDECLKEFKKPIVFIDADAIVEQDPILFDELTKEDVDIAVHYRYITDTCSKLLSGTLYVRPGKSVELLLRDWNRSNEDDKEILEQCNLEEALYFYAREQSSIRVRLHRLPASYCNIFDLMNVKDPVITHNQASRRLKKVMG